MKITRFEELIEKVVPWFIAVCLAVILWAVTGCDDEKKHVCPIITSKRYMGSNGWGVNKIQLPAHICEYTYDDGGDIWRTFQDSCKMYSIGDNICKNPIHKCDNQTGTK